MRSAALMLTTGVVLLAGGAAARATVGTVRVAGHAHGALGASVTAVPAQARLVRSRAVDEAATPASIGFPASAGPSPIRGVTAEQYRERKQSIQPVLGPRRLQRTTRLAVPERRAASTATLGPSFDGQREEPFPGGMCHLACYPPDQALAASHTWILQGVNDSWAVYSTAGVRQTGWPKSYASFFGVPAPSPSGCAPIPYMTDPRAFYDPQHHRFWALALEAEGTDDSTPGCDLASRYWIAVSQTADPRGAWNVYAFDMALGTQNAADFPGFGFDSRAVYFSGDMFSAAGTNFEYAEVFEANKAALEAGSTAFTADGFANLQADGVSLNTVQPVESEYPYTQKTEYLVNSFDLNSNEQCWSANCQGIVLWAFSNPIAHDSGGPDPTLSGLVVTSGEYGLSPEFHQPGCLYCVEVLDPRISGQPVLENGQIWAALDTGYTFGNDTRPSLYWFALAGTLTAAKGCPLCTTLTSAQVTQDGYFTPQHGYGFAYPVFAADTAGDVLMGFTAMGEGEFATLSFLTRAASDQPGFSGSGTVFYGSTAPLLDFPIIRWGDYNATAYDGVTGDPVWLAGEYVSPNGTWATRIGSVTLP